MHHLEIVGNHVLLLSAAPSKYPVHEQPSPEGSWLRPFELSYDILKAGVAAAHNNFVNGHWTIDNVRQFLQTHCINKEGIEFVLRNAQNTKMLKSLEGNVRYCLIIETVIQTCMTLGKDRPYGIEEYH